MHKVLQGQIYTIHLQDKFIYIEPRNTRDYSRLIIITYRNNERPDRKRSGIVLKIFFFVLIF